MRLALDTAGLSTFGIVQICFRVVARYDHSSETLSSVDVSNIGDARLFSREEAA